MDAEQIAAREAEELQKERKEMQQRLKSQEKRVDHFERAKRLEEIPLLQQAFKEKQVCNYVKQFSEFRSIIFFNFTYGLILYNIL